MPLSHRRPPRLAGFRSKVATRRERAEKHDCKQQAVSGARPCRTHKRKASKAGDGEVAGGRRRGPRESVCGASPLPMEHTVSLWSLEFLGGGQTSRQAKNEASEEVYRKEGGADMKCRARGWTRSERADQTARRVGSGGEAEGPNLVMHRICPCFLQCGEVRSA